MGKLEKAIKSLHEGRKTRSNAPTIQEFADLLTALRDDIDDQLRDFRKELEEHKRQNQTAIDDLKESLSEMESKLEQQQAKIRSLQVRQERETSQNMVNTLIFELPIPTNENKTAEQTVNEIIKHNLKLENVKVKNVRPLRSRREDRTKIIAQTQNRDDKVLILKNCKHLKNTTIRVSPWRTKEEQKINNHIMMNRRKFLNEGNLVRIHKSRYLLVKNPSSGDENYFISDGENLTITTLPTPQ